MAGLKSKEFTITTNLHTYTDISYQHSRNSWLLSSVTAFECSLPQNYSTRSAQSATAANSQVKKPRESPTKRPMTKNSNGWCCCNWDSFPDDEAADDDTLPSVICSLSLGPSWTMNLSDLSERLLDDENSIMLEELSRSVLWPCDSVSETSNSSILHDAAQPSEPEDSTTDSESMLLLDRQFSSWQTLMFGKFSSQ